MTLIQITSVLAILISGVVSSASGDSGLSWKRHYDSAKRIAQAAKKPLVVVLENPKSANQKIDISKLAANDLRMLSKGSFELCRVDATTDYGKKVAAAFGAREFPYTVVTDNKSKRIVFRKPGQMSRKDWTLALAKSRTAADDVDRVVARKVVVDDTSQSMSQSIQWQSSFEEAQAAMREQKRPLLLFLTAPGCLYCDKLKSDAFSQSSVIDEINKSFVAVQVNGRERKDVSGRFQFAMYPTLVVMHHTGEVVEMWSGFKGTADFNEHIEIAKSRLSQISE